MLIRKNISWRALISFTWFHIVWITLYAILAVSLYLHFELHWLGIPWLPVSIVGIAVSFFVGFKNNSSYDRMWEARKIWGAIVNTSRMWGSSVQYMVEGNGIGNDELHTIHKRLIKRHIAWLYVLRAQLLLPTSWEHASVKYGVGKLNQSRIDRISKLFNLKSLEEDMKTYTGDEYEELKSKANAATQLLDKNAEELLELKNRGLISDYRHVELQRLINDQYTEQGQCERIKKFPFPRQYATASAYFVGIFILLLPFGMLTEFEKLDEELIWLTVPFVTLVGWVFILMELIGDYSENPFSGLANDIPTLAICRTIEIDLLEMLGETDIPAPIASKNGILP